MRAKHARREQFNFLGYSFGPQSLRRDGPVYLAASPSRKSAQRLKDKIGTMLGTGDKRPREEVVTDLNRVLRGWAIYFSHSTKMPAFRAKRHKAETRGELTDAEFIPFHGHSFRSIPVA